MTLREAYRQLGLVSPMRWWSQIGDQSEQRTGLTTHMLIELYLDLLVSKRYGQEDKVWLFCRDRRQGQLLRDRLRGIHTTLMEDVRLDRVFFLTKDKLDERTRGMSWKSWAVFCDHAVWESPESCRFTPHMLIRRLHKFDEEGWQAFDRDNNPVCLLSQLGQKKLCQQRYLPFVISYADSYEMSSVVYPATTPTHNARVLLARPFGR